MDKAPCVLHEILHQSHIHLSNSEMKRHFLYLILMTIVSSGLFAQMNVSSDKISSYRWDDLQEDWVLVVNEKEYFTSFEFDEDFTYFLHITSDQTSRYDILSLEYDEERELFNYDIISDVGNEYFMIIDATDGEIYFVSSDDEPFMLVYGLIADEGESNPTPEYSTGTGFAISKAGHVATNYHVVEDAENITVAVPGPMGSRKLSAKVIVSDEKNDLAILFINDPDFGGFDPIPYGFRNSAVSVGEDVFVLGYPMTETMGEEVKLTNGIVNSKTGFQGDITMYQISAPVQPGNSGGPLFDEDGNIIGVVSAKHEGAENVNYAVKISYLKSLIDILPQQIALEENNGLAGMKLKDQMSIVSNFTFLISVNEDVSLDRAVSSSDFDSDNSTTGGLDNNSSSTEEIAAYHYEKAQEYFVNNDHITALDHVDQCIEALPNYSAPYFLKGFIYYYGINNYEKARENFTITLQMDEQDDNAFLYRGLANGQLSKNVDAIKDFSQAIAINSENTDAYFMRAVIKSDLSDARGALADYAEIIKREASATPNIYQMGTVYNNYGYQLIQMDRVKEALPYLDKAVELSPNESYIWGSRGEYHYRVGNYKACIRDMLKSIELVDETLAINSNPALPYYLIGMSKIQLKQYRDACMYLSKAGELGEESDYDSMPKYGN